MDYFEKYKTERAILNIADYICDYEGINEEDADETDIIEMLITSFYFALHDYFEALEETF